ncbi:MAG TPA: fibronectin type III domain-containing protein, partial [Acidimicrobiales bacterium]
MRPASQALTALLAVVAVTGGGLTTSVAAASGSSPRPAVEGAPSPPLNVQAAVDAGTTVTDGAVVSWTPPASPGVGDVTSYAVIPFDETSGATLAPSDVNGAPPATTATVSGVLAGDSYTFTVTAANFVGSSDASAPSNAVVPVGVAASQSDSATSSTPSGSATASLAMPGASSSITGTATGGEGTLTVATYPSPPIASTSIDGAFYDVRLSVAAGFTQLVLVFCGVQLPGSVRFWNPATRNYVPIPN